MTRRSSRRDERGATAVLAALVVAFALFAAGALAIDMGQAYAKRSALQSNVDMAVMAAAAELDTEGACNQEVVDTAEDYLARATNKVDGQLPIDLGGSPSDGDGFIRCDDWKVELWAPDAYVDFGMAESMGFDGVDVPAYAAAQIKSPGMSSSMPMYASTGCNSGSQIISDPPPGHSSPIIPDLSPDSTTHNAAAYTISPTEVPSAEVSETLTLTGTGLAAVTKVTFTMAGGPPDHHEVVGGAITVDTPGTQLSVSVPSEVLAKDGVWWVRVVKANPTDGSDVFSEEAEAETFIVGDVLFCDGSVSGNFGTIRVARDDSAEGHWVENNIIRGLEPRLAIHPSMTSGDCDGAGGSVTSDSDPIDGTNCIRTDPGFPGNELARGLAKNGGRLDKATTPGCSRTGTDSKTSNAPISGGVALNDDLLTCFMLDNTTRIQDLVDGAAPNKLSADIFKSPRFFQLPVFPIDPAHGASQHYPVIGFVPGFITNQPLWASDGSPGTVSTWNGLEFHANSVERLHVVLFDADSLPETAPAVGGEIDYLGYGTKVVVLVD